MNDPSHKQRRILVNHTDRARQLRRKAPIPERVLWGMLRSRRLGGMKFRRQHAVGPYITDFYCAEASLVVELDGTSHVGRAQADHRRTAYLESQGLSVLRVTNDDLLEDQEAVARAILHAAGKLKRWTLTPALSLGGRGGGASAGVVANG